MKRRQFASSTQQQRTLCAQEFLATTVLFVGVKLIDSRGAALTGELALLWGPLKAFFVGLYIVVLLLGTAGPTGALPESWLVPTVNICYGWLQDPLANLDVTCITKLHQATCCMHMERI